MQNVKIIYSNSDKIISKIIRMGTFGKWSHCGIIDFNKVIDARSKGVSISLYDEWVLNKNFEIVNILVDSKKKKLADEWLNKQIGLKYDFKFIKSLINPFRKIPVYIDEKNKYRCNELVYKYLIRCGIEELNQDWIFRSSPESLYQISKVLEKKNVLFTNVNSNHNFSNNSNSRDGKRNSTL